MFYRSTFLFIISFLILSIKSNGQNNFEYLITQFQKVSVSQKDSALYYLNTLEKYRNKSNTAKILNCKAVYAERWESDYKKGLMFLDTALISALDSIDYYMVINTKANLLKDLGKYSEAVKIYLNYLDYAKRNNKAKLIGKIYSNIGLAYAYANKDIDAVHYLRQSLFYFKKNKMEIEYYRTSMILATSFYKIDSLIQSGQYLFEAMNYFKNTDDVFFYADAMKEFSNVKYDMGQHDSAIYYMKESYKIFENQNAVEPLALISLNLSSCYLEIKNTKEAERYANLGYKYALENNAPDVLMMAAFNNYEIYKKINATSKALSFHELYVAYKDTFMNLEKENELNALNIQYNTLEKDNEILKNKTQITENDIIIQKQKTRIYFGSIILLFSIVTVFVVLYFIRKQKILNNKLEELNVFKNKVFTIISHDLRSPINSIISHSKEAASQNKALSALHILDNLLHWSYPQLNKNQLKIIKIILSEIIEEAIQQTSYLIENKHQKISLEIDENFTFSGDFDTTLIILRNLITNASKYSNEFDTIFITQKDRTITIQNRCAAKPDKGLGIGIKLCEDLAIQNKYKLEMDFNADVAKVNLEL